MSFVVLSHCWGLTDPGHILCKAPDHKATQLMVDNLFLT